MMYHSSLIKRLEEQPASREIFTEKNKSYSVGDLLESSTFLSKYLHDRGVGSSSNVVLAIEPSFQFLQVLYALMLLNAKVSIIDPEMGHDNYQAKLAQFDPDFAFVDSRILFVTEHPIIKAIVRRRRPNLPRFPKVKKCNVFTTGLWLPIVRKHRYLPKTWSKTETSFSETVDENDDFLVVYTSGTLAEPKGVVHSYAGLSQSVRLLKDLLENNKAAKIATHLPHFMLLGVSIGVQVFKWKYPLSGTQQYDFITQHHISILFGPPADFVELVKFCNASNIQLPDSLTDIVLGSAPIYPSFLQKIVKCADNARITCLYGMTENLMTTKVDGREKLQYEGEGDLVGSPFDGVDISIKDDEILVNSGQLFKHYYGSQTRVTPHKTGDLGRMTTDGNVVLLGRKKDMIIRRNFNLYPALYESSISRIEGVNEAALIGIYNEQKEDEDVVLVLDGVPSLDKKGVMRALQNGEHSIDKEALPDEIVFAKIPKSGRQSKPDKEALRQLLRAQK